MSPNGHQVETGVLDEYCHGQDITTFPLCGNLDWQWRALLRVLSRLLMIWDNSRSALWCTVKEEGDVWASHYREPRTAQDGVRHTYGKSVSYDVLGCRYMLLPWTSTLPSTHFFQLAWLDEWPWQALIVFFSGGISHVPNRSAIYQCQTLPTSSMPDGTGRLEYRLMISINFL